MYLERFKFDRVIASISTAPLVSIRATEIVARQRAQATLRQAQDGAQPAGAFQWLNDKSCHSEAFFAEAAFCAAAISSPYPARGLLRRKNRSS